MKEEIKTGLNNFGAADKDRLNIAVLFGGNSPEYAVSLQSAYAVLSHMDTSKYRPIAVGLTRQGEWYSYRGDLERIADDSWFRPEAGECRPALISPNRSQPLLLSFDQGEVERTRLDAVFPVLHGRNGEDGTVQGLCELAGLPLVGCGLLASALCMDKQRAHQLARLAGLAVPQALVLHRVSARQSGEFADVADAVAADDESIDGAADSSLDAATDIDLTISHNMHTNAALLRQTRTAAERLGYPLFVKPLRAGSSFGVSRIEDGSQLESALQLAFSYDDSVIVEEAIDGFEVGCAVLGNDRLIVGEPDEIELSQGFFDYTEKYTLKTSAIHVPARISSQQRQRVRQAAQIVYRALGCRGFARVDFFLSRDGRIVFNEVNTIPGFTAHSRFPNMLKAVGLSFAQVVDMAIELAVSAS